MALRQAGCALCNATWGDYWEEIEGKRLFFCCEVCAKQFKSIMEEAKRMTGWNSVDILEMEGDHRGRVCKVARGTDTHSFLISFYDNGDIRTLFDLS